MPSAFDRSRYAELRTCDIACGNTLCAISPRNDPGRGVQCVAQYFRRRVCKLPCKPASRQREVKLLLKTATFRGNFRNAMFCHAMTRCSCSASNKADPLHARLASSMERFSHHLKNFLRGKSLSPRFRAALFTRPLSSGGESFSLVPPQRPALSVQFVEERLSRFRAENPFAHR